MTICNMEMVYRHTNCVFNWQVTFSILLASIENSHFHFLLILDRGVNPRQTCDNSTFSLHEQNDRKSRGHWKYLFKEPVSKVSASETSNSAKPIARGETNENEGNNLN